MSLISCPDCGTQVSNSADKCPKCGYPISNISTAPAYGDTVQTIEMTAKRYKLQQLLSATLFVLGIVIFIVGLLKLPPSTGLAVTGLIVLLVGAAWYLVARVTTWWHHG